MAFRQRLKLMDAFDDAMLSFALKDAYPGVVFLDYIGAANTRLEERASIAECGDVVFIRFKEERSESDIEQPGRGWTRRAIGSPGPFMLQYRRNRWFWGSPHGGNWAFDLPTLEHALMAIDHDRTSKADRAFVNKLWRLLNRLMTNRLKNPLWHGPFTLADAKGGDFWAGHHALQWCREGERRMLMGCRIPCDDWALPDDDWYQDLYRRVVERYGPAFGDPTRDPTGCL